MDAYYFKERIFDELNDAKKYMTRAMECKADNLIPWAKKFDEMAMDELKHAEGLYSMFTDYYKQFDDKPDLKSYMEPFRCELVEDYIRYSSQIKYMHEMYSK